MKKWIVVGFLPFLLIGCGANEYVHSKEPRSTVYYGQSVADLYENFGTPTKATRISDNERILIYISQEIEKDWAYRYVRGCVMRFHLVDNRVVDWSADGQACLIQSREEGEMSVPKGMTDSDESGLFDSKRHTTEINSVAQPLQMNYQTGENRLPDDAFHGQAPTTYSTIPSRTTPSRMTIPENAVRGKASASWSRSGQLPADAFDGKASTTYIPVKSVSMNSSSAIIRNKTAQVPADAFDGQGAIPASTYQNSHFRKTFSNQSIQDNSYNDEEEWGLFD